MRNGWVFMAALCSTTCVVAEVATQTPEESMRYFIDGAFTYWYVKEEGMDVAQSAILSGAGATLLANNGTVFQQAFSYNPGFVVGVGVQGPDWTVSAHYTWVRSQNTTAKAAPANTTSISGTGVWDMDDWFLQTTVLGKSPTGTYVSSDCHLNLDIVDALASSTFYSGKNVEMSGAIGLRTVWIRQKMNIALTQALASVGSIYLPEQPIHSYNRSHSWGIGPKMGFDMKYLLGMGFRLEGDLAGSLLYTRFSSLKHAEDAVSLVAINIDGVNSRMDGYSAVRPVMEMGLAIGWQRDFGKYGLDLLAGYDFSLFWAQNAIRKMLDEYQAGTQAAAGDLYMQGMTLEARFKF